MIKIYLALIIVAFVIVSCSQDSNFKNNNDIKISLLDTINLDTIPIDNTIIDSVVIDTIVVDTINNDSLN